MRIQLVIRLYLIFLKEKHQKGIDRCETRQEVKVSLGAILYPNLSLICQKSPIFTPV